MSDCSHEYLAKSVMSQFNDVGEELVWHQSYHLWPDYIACHVEDARREYLLVNTDYMDDSDYESIKEEARSEGFAVKTTISLRSDSAQYMLHIAGAGCYMLLLITT